MMLDDTLRCLYIQYIYIYNLCGGVFKFEPPQNSRIFWVKLKIYMLKVSHIQNIFCCTYTP